MSHIYSNERKYFLNLIDISHDEKFLNKFSRFLVFNPHENAFEDLAYVRNNIKNKEKMKHFFEKIAFNLKKIIFFMKKMGKMEKNEFKKRYKDCYPIEKLIIFFEEIICNNENEIYPAFKLLASNLTIFFSYFYNENSELVYKFNERSIKHLILGTQNVIPLEKFKDFIFKYVLITFKKKRFILWHLLNKYLFGSFHLNKIREDENLDKCEAFFEAISKELKSINRFEINLDDDDKFRKKLILICDLITRFTHQIEITSFYTKDLGIKIFVKIEEIFTKPVININNYFK